MFFVETIRRWWRDRDRFIFAYHDGNRKRYADPVVIGNDLEAVLPDYQSYLDTLNQNVWELPPGALRDDMVAQQRMAAKKLADAARVVFKLPELDEGTGWGATDNYAIRLLGQWFIYMERLARKAEVFPDSPEAELASPPA